MKIVRRDPEIQIVIQFGSTREEQYLHSFYDEGEVKGLFGELGVLHIVASAHSASRFQNSATWRVQRRMLFAARSASAEEANTFDGWPVRWLF